jgi:putative hemolysin
MTISYPLPETAETLYHVTLHNNVSGFCWQANVDAEGEIVTTGLEAGMLPELSNAAAAYCEEQGHTYEVREQSDGQQCGECVFDSGESCKAWAYFQGMCER